MACLSLLAGITAFTGGGKAWASAVPSPGSIPAVPAAKGDYNPFNETLKGAQGSQLGLYYDFEVKGAYYQTSMKPFPFMELKFSPGAVTVYYLGSPNDFSGYGDMTTPFGNQDTEFGVDLDFCPLSASLSNFVPSCQDGQWVYTPPSTGTGTVSSYTFQVSPGYRLRLYYPFNTFLASYGKSGGSLNFDPVTFNSAYMADDGEVGVNTGKFTSSSNNAGGSTNYFEDYGSGFNEVDAGDEEVEFKNGAKLDFDPSSGTFDLQGGSSTSSSLKITSASKGEVLETLGLSQSERQLPFAPGNKIEISTNSSNPIVGAQNTFSGNSITASKLEEEGWNLPGNNTVVNRYDSVQLDWQPDASELSLYRYMLFKYLGSSDFNSLRTRCPSFFSWLMNDPMALSQFLTSGYACTSTIGGMGAYFWGDEEDPASELSALEIWSKIWKKYPASRAGENLKIAIAVALDFSHNVIAWMSQKAINPVGRYEIYAKAFKDGTLIGTFGDYSTQMLRDVVDDRVSNTGLEWLRDFVLKHATVYTNPSFTYKGYSVARYRFYSPYGFVQNGGFYGPDATIWNLLRYAGVCGSLSKMSVFILNALGEPGLNEGQSPQGVAPTPYTVIHCAYIYFYINSQWELGYRIAGWKSTGGLHSTLPLMFNGTQLNEDQFTKGESYFLDFQAEEDMALGNWVAAESDADKAITTAPNNLRAWQTYIEVCNHLGKTQGLKEKIQNEFDSLSANNQPYSGGLNYDNIISSLTSQIKS